MKINHRVRAVTDWVLVGLLGLSFLAAGIPKIAPGPGMVRRFEAWGYTAEFATVIGVVESRGGLLVLHPKTRRLGASIIAIDMAGAIYTHFSTGIGSPTMAIVYFGLAIGIAAMAGRPGGPS